MKNEEFIKEYLEVVKPKTAKDFIKNYIVLNLFYNKGKILEAVPSENQLAIKFDVSRLTVRDVMQEFVQRGILQSKRGSGYYVATSIRDHIFLPNKYSPDKYRIIESKPTDEDLSIMKQEGLDKMMFDYKNAHTLVRDIMLKSKLVEKSIIGINKDILPLYKVQEDRNIELDLARAGIKPKSTYIETFIVEEQKYKELKAKLNGDKFLIVEMRVSHNEKGGIFAEARMKRSDDFKNSYTRNYVY